MNLLYTFLLLLFPQIESPEIVLLEKSAGFRFAGYTVRETYILSSKEKFIIASQSTPDNTDIEGLRFLYLIDNKIAFKSEHVWESYIYRPAFYKFKDNSMLVVCETGFEYSTGIDIFEYKGGNILKMGNIDIATNEGGDFTGILPNMAIEKTHQYVFTFKGPVVVNPGGKQQHEFEGRQVKAIYYRNQGQIGLLISN